MTDKASVNMYLENCIHEIWLKVNQISFDPEISEWGNPLEQTSSIHTPIHNVWKGTRGTETSKYPEEKKQVRKLVILFSYQEIGNELSGGDAPGGNTRTHPEHDG